ncbi:MAG: hypothetical protein C0605_07340 [Hyphomicrobiales bacterium]|nr:MAG: hypothetical protein C0605_07340 [Hyphomicrobiales bacterium]
MPHIEAAHIGLLPLDLARRFIFIRQRDDGDFYSWENQIFDRTAYEALQSEWKEDYDIARKSI